MHNEFDLLLMYFKHIIVCLSKYDPQTSDWKTLNGRRNHGGLILNQYKLRDNRVMRVECRVLFLRFGFRLKKKNVMVLK